MILRGLALVSLLSLLVGGAAAASETNVCLAPIHALSVPAAQTSACLTPDAVTAARAACANTEVGQVCLGAGDVQTTPAGGLVIVGSSLALAGIDSLQSSAGGLAFLTMQADLPDGSQPIELTLYGDASITSAVSALAEPYPTAQVKNGPANILNLRAAPNESADVVTTMKWSEELTADGRSSDSQWLRVQTSKGPAWVFASLVTVKEGDVTTLYVLDSPITHHLQGFTLSTGDGACASGLLIQSANRETAHLQINGALLSFSTAALAVQSELDQALTVRVLGGIASVSAAGTTVEAEAGTTVSIPANAAPELAGSFAFGSLASLPLGALPDAAQACFAGVTDGTAALTRAPGVDAAAAGALTPDSNVTVSGQRTVDGAGYWLTADGQWVAQSAVQTAGFCAEVPEAPQQNTAQSGQTSSFARDLLPEGRSIWQAHTGVDNLSGVCTAPPIAQCDHLAAVTTQPNGTIAWLGQEPAPYTLAPSGANTFSYRGRNQLNNANLSLTVTFTSPTTWVGTMNIVYDGDAGCTHTFNYTAERIR